MFDSSKLLRKQNLYHFEKKWGIDAPLEEVWAEIMDFDNWPVWWNSIERIASLDRECDLSTGTMYRTEWRGNLPYSFTFDTSVKEVDRFSYISGNVHGDLNGSISCGFSTNNKQTEVSFLMDVKTSKLWMTALSPLLKRYFKRNHEKLMEEGVRGFSDYMAVKCLKKFENHTERPH